MATTTRTITIPPQLDPVAVLGPVDEVIREVERAFPDLTIIVRGNRVAIVSRSKQTEAQAAQADALEQQIAGQRSALPYPQRAEAQAALDALETRRTVLRTGMEQAQAALKRAEQAHAAAQAAVDALQAQALAAVLMEDTP